MFGHMKPHRLYDCTKVASKVFDPQSSQLNEESKDDAMLSDPLSSSSSSQTGDSVQNPEEMVQGYGE